ncbi:hypothetical protein [Aestuariivirga sp.]|uniref:hypothetical protein n=1 Tax=Aestuariivirga sp. TaxID=2650926 RepID=UPI003BA8CD63
MTYQETNEFAERGFRQQRYGRERYGQERYSEQNRTRGASSDILGTVTDAVRENPMSAALIGMGALWLFMGGNGSPLSAARGGGALLRNVASGAGSMAKGTTHAASRMGNSVASTVASTASNVAETVGDAAGRLGEYVSGSVRGVDANSEYRNANVADGMGDDESATGYGVGAAVSSYRGSMQDMLERYPLALGVAGLALGAGIAASLPLSSTERETLGKVGEAARSKIDEVTGQAREIAGAVADEVRQHATGTGNGNGQGF